MILSTMIVFLGCATKKVSGKYCFSIPVVQMFSLKDDLLVLPAQVYLEGYCHVCL